MSRRGEILGHLSTSLVVLCTVVLTATIVRREFFAPPAMTGLKPVKLSGADWAVVSRGGHRIGPENAMVTVVEFSDFECPFCARFSQHVVTAIRAAYPNDVAFVYRHFPLDKIHKEALPAARAAECAAEQGKFEAFHTLLFAQHDSLGAKPYSRFAKESAVPNLSAFETCAARTDRVNALESDVSDAKQLGVRGTPTVFANGWRLSGGVDSTIIDSIVRTERKRKLASK